MNKSLHGGCWGFHILCALSLGILRVYWGFVTVTVRVIVWFLLSLVSLGLWDVVCSLQFFGSGGVVEGFWRGVRDLWGGVESLHFIGSGDDIVLYGYVKFTFHLLGMKNAPF